MTSSNKPQRALILDDDTFFTELLGEMLHSLKLIDILTESDGHRALLAVKAEVPDILFCDINMPGMDGVEFLRRLTAQGYAGSVVLISGENVDVLKAIEHLAQAHGLNVLGVLEKPFEIEALMATIARHGQSLPKSSDHPTKERLTAEEIRDGFERNRLVVFFQPKVTVYGYRVPDVECLARWQHPERGLLTPDCFIDTAEKSGLIGELTQIVLCKAATHLSQWRQKGANVRVAINVSMDTLRQLELPDIFEAIVRKQGLEPAHFLLEITESRLMTNLAATLDILTRFRIKGFGLSIDDFGTGYSTMESLMHLPFTELKLDRAFVNTAIENTAARAILETSVKLGRTLQLNLVAEGVETRQDWGIIAALGCHEMQGYLITKPMPAEKVLDWIRHWESQTIKNSPITADRNEAYADDSKKILVVDDDDFMCEMLDAALGHKCRIVFAQHAEEALQVAQTQLPDMILLDVELPEIDGYEICRQLKMLDGTMDIPVVFVSGHDLVEDRIKGYEAGGEDYITKPFNPLELETKITHLFHVISERASLKDRVGYATDAAMTAMTSMGELGLLLETIKNFNVCTHYDALASAMLEGIGLYGLHGAIQIRAPQQTLTRNNQGEASPLELSVIAHMATMDRIEQFKSNLAITYDHVSLLVNDLPKDDADRCGRLRDHLAMLVEASEMRVHGISDSIELLRRGEAIARAVSVITETLKNIDTAQREQRIEACLAASSLKDNVEKALLQVGLSETEDEFLSHMIQDGIDKVLSVQSAEQDIQDKLTGIIANLNALIS